MLRFVCQYERIGLLCDYIVGVFVVQWFIDWLFIEHL